MPDLEEVARDLRAALQELALAAGVEEGRDERPPLGFEMPKGRPRAPARRARPSAGRPAG